MFQYPQTKICPMWQNVLITPYRILLSKHPDNCIKCKTLEHDISNIVNKRDFSIALGQEKTSFDFK